MNKPVLASNQPRRLYLPRATRRLGQQLLTQQCWCWGQDVRRPEGNLLLQYGFERQRPPHGESGATTYILRASSKRYVALWGFGFWYGESGSGAIFVGRFAFEPRFSAHSEPPLPIWMPSQLNEIPAPASTCQRRVARELLKDALRWAAGYEEWCIEHTGLDYRRRCLEAWSQPFLPPEQVAASWENVARSLSVSRRTTHDYAGLSTTF